MVLLVLVLQGGTVKQRMLSLEEPVDQEALSRLSNELNDRFAGWPSRADCAASCRSSATLGQQIGQIVVADHGRRRLSRPAIRSTAKGWRTSWTEPEFAEGKQVRQMVQVLEGPSLTDVITAVAQPLEVGGVQVLIGGEGRWEELTELSLVLSRYGVKGSATGLLGVVGPIRMPYDRTIGAVRYVSQLMTALVSDWYSARSRADES